MIFKKKDIVNAYFLNDKRKVVRVIHLTDDGQTVQYIVPTDPDNKDYKALLKVYSIDKIEKNTIEYAERINEGVKQILIEANVPTKEESSEQTAEEIAYDLMLFLFSPEKIDPNANVDIEEIIFNMKLLAFDMDQILDADDQLKEKIRNETNILKLIRLIEDGISGSVEVD